MYFKSLRIQIIQPCQAKCKWCGTWKKNPEFAKLLQNKTADKVHNFYSDIIRKFKPQSLYVSGGEPLLLPGIDSLMAEFAENVEKRIYLFTSYQFTEKSAQSFSFDKMPWDKVILTHTSAGFHENRWFEMTGFPYKLYIENIKKLTALPWKKRFKFILNHDELAEEIRKFNELVQPDDTFTISLKLLNNQAGNFGKGEIKKTAEHVKNILKNGLPSLPVNNIETNITGMEVLEDLDEGKDISGCRYRHDPLELRFAYYKKSGNDVKLKYRFCSHFPSDKGFVFKTGRDTSEDIIKNYEEKKWHRWCSSCRLKLYK